MVCLCVFPLELFFFVVIGLELRAYTLSYSASPFSWGFFRDRVSWTICPGWLQTSILLISASWVARITGVSHQHPAHWNVIPKVMVLRRWVRNLLNGMRHPYKWAWGCENSVVLLFHFLPCENTETRCLLGSRGNPYQTPMSLPLCGFPRL
jgi:hypothetical protein